MKRIGILVLILVFQSCNKENLETEPNAENLFLQHNLRDLGIL